jgi:RNA polymerase sigma-70 factor (ECF subfamily)
MNVDEWMLIDGAKKGDMQAYEQLVRMFQAQLRAFFAMRLRDKALAEDLAQEVFVVAYRKVQSLRSSVPFYAWLKGIAVNIYRNELRRRKEGLLGDAEAVVQALDAAAADYSDSLEARSAQTDFLEAMVDCKDRLDPVSRGMVEDHYTRDMGLSAIALQVGKSAKAVAVSLVRIRRVLRECIEHKTESYAAARRAP